MNSTLKPTQAEKQKTSVNKRLTELAKSEFNKGKFAYLPLSEKDEACFLVRLPEGMIGKIYSLDAKHVDIIDTLSQDYKSREHALTLLNHLTRRGL